MRTNLPVVLSAAGKGGVGKTSLACTLTFSLARAGLRPGLLDADVKNPKVPVALKLNGAVETYKQEYVDRNGIPRAYPYTFNGVSFPVFSTAFLFGHTRGIILEGETLRQLVIESIHKVVWPDIDVLVIDLDPSAGDSVVAVRDCMKNVAAIIITEDDAMTIGDALREIDAFESPEMRVPVLGLLGNRIGYTGPPNAAAEEANLKRCASKWGIPYLASMPMDTTFRTDSLKAFTVIGAPVGDQLAQVVKRWMTDGLR